MNQHQYVPTYNFPILRGYILQLPEIFCCLLLLLMLLKKYQNVLIINIYNFQEKIMIYRAMTILTIMHNYLRLKEKTIIVTCQIFLKNQNELQEVKKNSEKIWICWSKSHLSIINPETAMETHKIFYPENHLKTRT